MANPSVGARASRGRFGNPSYGFRDSPHLERIRIANGLLIETALAGRPIGPRLRGFNGAIWMEATINWLTNLHQATVDRRARNVAWYEQLVERPLQLFMKAVAAAPAEANLVKQTRYLARTLRHQDIPLAFEHGDFGPPNILVAQDGRLRVVDWELARARGLPAVDLFFFLTLVGFARSRARKPAEYLAAFRQMFFGQSATARHYIQSYVDSLGVPAATLVPLFVLCWSRYVAELALRLHDFQFTSESLSDETMNWLRSNRYYALWRYTIDHLDELNLA